MTAEERDARLTAYALNEPGLSAADRQEVESALAADPAVRRAVEETRALAQLLTTGLAAEQAAMPAETPVTIPSSVASKPKRRGWKLYTAAAAVMLAVLGGLYAAFNSIGQRYAPRIERGSYSSATLDAVVGGDNRSANELRWESTLSGSPPAPQLAATPGLVDRLEELNAGKKPAASYGGYARGRPGNTSAVPATRPSSPAPGRQAQQGAATTFPGGIPGESSPGMFGQPQTGRAFEPVLSDRLEMPSPHDRYPSLAENGFVAVTGQDALSTFGVDVDTASYAIVRKYLTMGQMPPANAVRLEELVNYFRYQDKPPEGDDPFAVTVELAECPWQPKHRLARIGVKAKPIANDKRPPSNLVFLVDVSGSMNEPAKLPLVKASLRMLVNQLGENDRVAMVVYAGAAGLVLDSTPAVKKDRILEAIDRLQAGGSTNGAGGIQQAYAVAAANFIKGGTNRVILCTDGDWNVGTTSTDALVKMIEEKRGTGVFLSVFGFGMGNLRDEMMVRLAGKGNGNYGYIDSLREANKALVEQLGGTLVTVAKDVKIQVEFNPAKVGAYRLLGYEKRILAAKDFHDDKKDAGEMGAGHVVTALYELVPAGTAAPAGAKPNGLRYQPDPAPRLAAAGEKAKESFVVKMRHKKPDADTSTYRELPVTDPGCGYAEASEDFRFAAAVASFALLLRDSRYKGDSSFALVLELAEAAKKHDPGKYRAEFVELVKKAKTISGRP